MEEWYPFKITPMEPDRHPDPYPGIVDELVATLRLHGTANERAVILQWARERYRQ